MGFLNKLIDYWGGPPKEFSFMEVIIKFITVNTASLNICFAK